MVIGEFVAALVPEYAASPFVVTQLTTLAAGAVAAKTKVRSEEERSFIKFDKLTSENSDHGNDVNNSCCVR